MPADILYRFTERHSAPALATGKEWELVLIEAGWSKNRGEGGLQRYYPADVLRKAVKMFEGLPANIFLFGDKLDHLPEDAIKRMPGGYAANNVGWYHKVRYGKFTRPNGQEGEGIIAQLHVMEGCEWLRKNMRDAWDHGQTDLYQFSIDAEGTAEKGAVDGKPAEIVTSIDSATSEDVVSRAAAGGGLLRLVASQDGEVAMSTAEATVFELLKEHRPMWLDGFEEADEGQDETEHVVHILETNLAQAEDELRDLPEDATRQRLEEQARGVKTLGSVIRMLRGGKAQEAMKLLQNWIAVYPVMQRGTAQSRAGGFYSFPYGAPQSGYPGAGALKPYGTTPPARQAASEPEEDPMDEANKAVLDRIAKLEQEVAVREACLRVKERVSESGLPKPGQARVMALVEPRLTEVTDEEVDTAIQSERDYIASLKESGKPTGLGNANAPTVDAQVVKDQYEKYVSAFMGYFANEDQDGIPRFRTLREAYAVIAEAAGKRVPYDVESQSRAIWMAVQSAISPSEFMPMAEHLEHLRESWSGIVAGAPKRFRESIDTATLPVAFGDAFDRRLQAQYTQDPRQDYKELATTTESLKDLNNKKRIIRVGALDDLPVVAEKATYNELTPVTPTEEEAQLGVDKHGGTVIVSWESILADEDNFIRTIPDRMALAAIRTLQKAVFDLLESNPVFAATGNNFISSGHNNIVVGTLTFPNLVLAIEQMRNQKELDSNEKLGLRPDTLWVPVELEQEAVEILESDVKITSTEDSTVRSFINRLGLKIRVSLALGLVAGTTDQAYLTVRKGDSEGIAVGFLNGREAPEVFRQSPMDTPNVGLAFSSDQMTLKIRHVWGVIPVDFRFVQGLIP